MIVEQRRWLTPVEFNEILANAWKTALPLRGQKLATGVAACILVVIAVLRLPLAVAMRVLAITSSLPLWRFRA